MARRRIVIVRHGERVDFTFTDEWINTCFSDNNTYIKHNLNMPDEVPNREGSPRSFHNDCPLTQIGFHQATLTGKGLLDDKILRDGFQVYVSPALRCVQTATGLLKGMNKTPVLKIEPGLFEWTQFFSGDVIPTFMTLQEYKENNYNVDLSYVPLTQVADLKDQSLEEYYNRSYQIVQHLISSTEDDLILVAHGASLDTFTRQLFGRSIPNTTDFMTTLKKVPYCGVAVAEKDDQDKWNLISTPRITLRHNAVQDFDASRTIGQGR